MRAMLCACWGALTLGAAPALAMDVALVGVFGSRAVLVIDGGTPRTLAVGKRSPEGVLLVSVDGDRAVVEAAGRRDTLRLGERAAWRDGSDEAMSVTLHADSRGHFVTDGHINDVSIRFLVDTGATAVAIGRGDAQRIGVDPTRGEEVHANTANGVVRAWSVRFERIRLGALELRDVEGMVMEHDMSHALLGMSFLRRTQQNHQGGTLTLSAH
ncbi:TIGR02281 family clan AA aspartic protease [Pseudothauera nasutitermitis]|uniref:TIGR02281 family clan AA aspartic protease n=1 Tax=Pseudothauera nasutitermitis TaxID=2565930 RepID=A0A4S4AP46_9RHOO|nr:TIGR02281 family clan AA aspartic protease [Pseudothauera nasutitermitis]THF61439.1 TIGR02281 family clan AA aspartic protease [Pseudothauera nasutitermitis]